MRTRPTMHLIQLIRSARIMRLLVLGAALSAATPAVSHAAAPCSRPIPPPAPLTADEAHVLTPSEQLTLDLYGDAVGDYLACLERERDATMREWTAPHAAWWETDHWYRLGGDPLTRR